MKKFVILAGLLAATPALAGDGYVNTDRFDWTGVYVGVQGGYADGEHSGRTTYTDKSGAYDLGGGTIDLNGGVGGVTLGAQRQFGSLVLGVEGDFSWGDISGDQDFDLPGGYRWNVDTEINKFGTLRGRVGWSLGHLMIYGTGGAAWADISSHELASVTTNEQGIPKGTTVVDAKSSEDKWGWVAGAGAEWQFREGWSLKAEWLRIDLGDVDTQFTGFGYPNQTNYTNDSFPGKIEFDVYRMGLNYNF